MNEEASPGPASVPAAAAVWAHDLVKVYGGGASATRALDGVKLLVPEGTM